MTLNPLTRETRNYQAAVMRADKAGRIGRGGHRSAAWAWWKLTGDVLLPGHIKFELEGNVIRFGQISHVPGQWVDVPSGNAKNRKVWADGYDVFHPLTDALTLPTHCQSVKNADLWHTAHQAGHYPEDCFLFSDNFYHRKELDVPPCEWRARQAAQRAANEWRYLNDGAEEILRQMTEQEASVILVTEPIQ